MPNRRFITKSFSQYIVSILAFCAIAIIIAMAFSAYYSAEQGTAEQFNTHQLMLAKEASVGIENFFAEIENNLNALANKTASASTDTIPQDMQYSFDILRSKISSIFYIKPEESGFLLHSLPSGEIAVDKEIVSRYFNQLKRDFEKGKSKLLVSNLITQKNGFKELMIIVPVIKAVGLTGENRLNGAFGVVITPSKIIKLFIESIVPGKTGYAWLMDNQGTLIHHPKHPEMLDRNIFKVDKHCIVCHISFKRERNMIRQKEGGKILYQSAENNQYKLLAYSPIKVGNRFWLVAVVTPYSEITMLVRQSFKKTLALIGTAVMIIFFVALYTLKINKMWIIAREEKRYLEEESRLQKKIRETKEYLEQVLFSAGEAIISTDQEGLITIWNRASEGIFGYNKKEIMKKPMHILMPDEKSKAQLTEYLGKVARQGHVECEHIYLCKDGKRFTGWCNMMAVKERRAPYKLIGYISVIRDITEWKKLESSLRESEEQYRSLIEESQDAVVVLQGADIVYVNPAFLKMFGYKNQAQVLGKSLEANTAPESLDFVRKRAFIADKKQQSPSHFEYRGVKTDGMVFDIEVNAKLTTYKGKPALQAFLRDVTIRKKIEHKIKEHSEALEKKIEKRTKQLRESQQLLEAISENAPLEVAVIDKEGKFIYVNKFWEWITGKSRKQAIGKKVNDLCPQLSSNSEFKQMLRHTFEYGESQKEIKVNYKEATGHYKNEEVNKIFWSIPFFNERGKVIKLAVMGYDVTEIKRLEMQLIQSEKLAATGKLVAGIAHEINNPLYGIQGCLDSISNKKELDNKDRKFIDLSYRETLRISGLIRRLQDLYRPSEEIMSPIDIKEIIRDVLLLEAAYLKQVHVKLHTKYQRNLPQVLATSDQLKQVFINLVSNARDSMPQGGDLTIITKSDNDNVLVTVIDTGYGIPKENVTKIFDAFFTTKKEVKGVGLGLSVSYGIISRHNGKIEVESEQGKGAKFTVILPIYKVNKSGKNNNIPAISA